jgi:hypothetical protein
MIAPNHRVANVAACTSALPDTDLVLHVPETGAYGGFVYAEFLRGASKAAAFSDRDNIAKMARYDRQPTISPM